MGLKQIPPKYGFVQRRLDFDWEFQEDFIGIPEEPVYWPYSISRIYNGTKRVAGRSGYYNKPYKIDLATGKEVIPPKRVQPTYIQSGSDLPWDA